MPPSTPLVAGVDGITVTPEEFGLESDQIGRLRIKHPTGRSAIPSCHYTTTISSPLSAG